MDASSPSPQDRLRAIVDWGNYPLDDPRLSDALAEQLAEDGVIALDGFLRPNVTAALREQAAGLADKAYFTNSTHNVYLTPKDEARDDDHVFNRQLVSSKGCITTDQVPAESDLVALYDAPAFRQFIARIVGEDALFEYADPLSSINVHYAGAGKELNWHFDNSEFAITLLLQKPEDGGRFEYLRDVRDAEAGEMNFDGVEAILDGRTTPSFLPIEPGTLVLFRGRNAIHRVTPTIGDTDRILVVLAYNSKPGIALSETARMTFFGRLG
ncbi:MAG: 2OG-Fe(II) oxygenase [Alphaproteobacteria bacterium]|nr:2OG-Fe(II) oxygenase [Alphaproteobacteria bacterium]